MAANLDEARIPDSEAAAHRRWLISVGITLLLGGFGAVMAYLSYVRGAKSATRTIKVVNPPVTQPDNDKPDQGKPDQGKPDQGKPDKGE